MRIISGTYKGRTIKAVPSKKTRPTTDRVREAWASSVMSLAPEGRLRGASVLDAFAGSGALGLELLSRGAETCLFVEKNRAAVPVLIDNIESLGLSRQQAEVCVANSLSTPLPVGICERQLYDIVILDPPYTLPQAEVARLITLLARTNLLVRNSLISYEHAAANKGDMDGLNLSEKKNSLSLALAKRKEYGTICIDYYLCT